MDWKKLSSKKIVLAGGVFDIIHPGHIHTLNAAKALGDVLVVVIATDKIAKKMKKRQPLHNQELRCELVNSLSIVDVAIVGNEDDIFETVKLVKPNVIALGYDQIHQEKFISDGCKRINLDVKIVRLQSPAPKLSRAPKLSSSYIKKEYGKDIHDL
ncbi:MAG: FAD synthase [Marine Group I thaumarchaeote]|nr:FAD synthase [Marine Group I thaumarchaeote]